MNKFFDFYWKLKLYFFGIRKNYIWLINFEKKVKFWIKSCEQIFRFPLKNKIVFLWNYYIFWLEYRDEKILFIHGGKVMAWRPLSRDANLSWIGNHASLLRVSHWVNVLIPRNIRGDWDGHLLKEYAWKICILSPRNYTSLSLTCIKVNMIFNTPSLSN